MIYWILSRMEENPNAVFYGKELEARFSKSFESSVKDRLLVRIPPNLSSYSHGLNSQYRVVESEDGLEAIDEDDPETEPINLSNDDLAQYKLDLEVFARKVQQANELSGTLAKLSERLYFFGETYISGELGACVLAFINASPITHQILPSILSLLPTTYKKALVVCPSQMPDLIERRHLETLHIQVMQLKKDNPFSLPLLNSLISDSPPEDGSFWHSEDYRSIRWQNRFFTLRLEQAEVIKMLDQARTKSSPDVSWARIKLHLENLQRYPEYMKDIFRDSQLWGTLIKSPSRGIYRLDL